MPALGRVELYATATFDSDGQAVAVTAPVPWGRTWRITSVTVATSLAESGPATSATVYRGTAVQSNQLDTTRRGGNGATTDVAITLYAGEALTVVWTGGTPGATATVTATGEG